MSGNDIVVHGDDCSASADHKGMSLRYMRTDARFLAHLVAIRSNAADHRLKNRTLPELGAAAYRLSEAKPLQNNAVCKNRSA